MFRICTSVENRFYKMLNRITNEATFLVWQTILTLESEDWFRRCCSNSNNNIASYVRIQTGLNAVRDYSFGFVSLEWIVIAMLVSNRYEKLIDYPVTQAGGIRFHACHYRFFPGFLEQYGENSIAVLIWASLSHLNLSGKLNFPSHQMLYYAWTSSWRRYTTLPYSPKQWRWWWWWW